MNTTYFRRLPFVLGVISMLSFSSCGDRSAMDNNRMETVQTTAAVATPVELLGIFSNESSDDGEHSSGYSLFLWHQGDVLIGRFEKATGLLGNYESVLFENGKVVDRQQIAFRGTLEGKAFEFDGGIGKTGVEGKIRFTDEVQPEKIMLPNCCDDAALHKSFSSIEEWRDAWPE